MHQYRLRFDPLHIVAALDDEHRLESRVEVLRFRGIALGVPIVCCQSSFLGKLCKMLVAASDGIYTDEDVPLMLWTPAISDGIIHPHW